MQFYLESAEALEQKSIVYFVGITGSGKSMLINYMLGHTLKIDKLHGARQIVLDDPEGSNKAIIGTNLATSCTLIPKLYTPSGYDNLMICDTSGYCDQGPLTQTCELLNELYLTRAQ